MILRPVALVPPNPLAGPRKIGDAANYVEFDPANAAYTLAGSARPTWRLPVFGPVASGYGVGAFTATNFGSNADASAVIHAVSIASTDDGGWRSLPLSIPPWVDVSEAANFVVLLQASAAASGNLSLRVDWDRARPGTNDLSEPYAANVLAGPTAAKDILQATAAVLPAGGFAVDDVVSFAVRRLGASDANDTYTQPILIARYAWIEFKRRSL